MARKMNKPRLVVNSFYGNKPNEAILNNYVSSIINGNELLKSSFDTIGIREFTEYNARRSRERRNKYGITA